MSYNYSTASNKSTCLTLALVALTTAPASASSSAFETTSIIKRARPVLHLPSMSASAEARRGGNSNPQRRNTSMYHCGDNNEDVDDFELIDQLPRELAARIASASAESSSPAAAPTISPRRSYPAYTDGGQSCSAKSSSSFSSWEVSYGTLHECCNESFSWDYDACMDRNTLGEDELDLLHLLPRELAAMIASASAESSSPAAVPTISPRRYYPTYTDGGESCSAKSSSSFSSWEVSYDTMHACCNESFGWDYDACMSRNTLRL